MAGRGVPFHRCRRVTGYLISNAKLLHHSKRVEVFERVKHVTTSDYTTCQNGRETQPERKKQSCG